MNLLNQTRILNLSLNIKRILWCNQFGWNGCENNSTRFRTHSNRWSHLRRLKRTDGNTQPIICHYISSFIPRARKFLLAGFCWTVSMFDVSISVYASIHPADKLGSSLFDVLHNFNYYRQWNLQTTLSVGIHCIRASRIQQKVNEMYEQRNLLKNSKR